MPLSSEVEVKVEPVSVFVRVTVAPTIALPWASITVPRRDARYWASAVSVRRSKEERTTIKRSTSFEFIHHPYLLTKMNSYNTPNGTAATTNGTTTTP